MAIEVNRPALARALLSSIAGNAVATTPAVFIVFGLFLSPLSSEFGWSRATISVSLLIVSVVSALLYPLAGHYADKSGARKMVLSGLIIYGMALASLSLLKGNLVALYLGYGLIAVFGAMASTPVYTKVLTDWFPREKQGLVLAFGSGGGNTLGAIVLAGVVAILVDNHGWRAAYLFLGAAVLLVAVPLQFFLLRDAPRYKPSGDAVAPNDQLPPEGHTLSVAVGKIEFWLILLTTALGAGIILAIVSLVVPILAERSISDGTGPLVIAIFAICTPIVQLLVGGLLDRRIRPALLLPMFLAPAGAVVILATATSTPMLALSGLLLAMGMGTQFASLPIYTFRQFGILAFGSITGIMYSAMIIAQGLVPLLLNWGFDSTESYVLGLIACAVWLGLGSALFVWLGTKSDSYGLTAKTKVEQV